MSQGQEGDTRPWRKARKDEYYSSKSAFEKKPVTSWPRCENCGLEVTGKSYMGSKSGRYICQQCWNER